jgi:hypothetical protein
MARTYPPAASLAAVGAKPRRRSTWAGAGIAAAAALGLPLVAAHRVRGEALFTAQAVDPARFAVLARPVSRDDWTLLVLEQLATEPRCWTRRADGLIDPSLNRFNFTGICSRYIDSNGYSLRVGQEDLANRWRLRLQQVGGELQLLASTVSHPVELIVGRGRVPSRDRDAFVALQLEPGWLLQRRTYQGQGLSHLYFANAETLPGLLARLQPAAAPAPAGRFPLRGPVPPALAALPAPGMLALPGRPIPLPVIPFRY